MSSFVRRSNARNGLTRLPSASDISLVPFDDLNVQQIHLSPHAPPATFLSFAPPAPALAVPFLHLLSLHAGHVPFTGALEKLYDSTAPRPYPAWLLQQQMGTARRGGGGGFGGRPLPSWTSSQPIPAKDLRKAIMLLEFESSDRPPTGQATEVVLLQQVQAGHSQDSRFFETGARVDPSTRANGLSAAFAAADALSWADAHVAKRVEVRIEVRPQVPLILAHTLTLSPAGRRDRPRAFDQRHRVRLRNSGLPP